MKNIKHIKTKNRKTKFDKKVLSAIQHIHPYVKHRIYIAESIGVLPKNMYTSNGIIDEGIVKLYKRGFDQDSDALSIKIELFKIIDLYLNELFKKEAFHKNTVSTSSILKEELDNLEEKYTTDADLDYVMDEDLDDISYKQNNNQKHLFLYENNESTILNALEIENISTENKKRLLGNLYSLPIKTTDILDLYIFGKLSFKEISIVKQIEIDLVEKIFNTLNKNFKKI